MTRKIHFILLILAFAAACLQPALESSAEESTKGLDGNSYVVEVRKEGEENFANENIDFAEGKLETTFLEDDGFPAVEYQAQKEGALTQWRAVSKNKSGDSISWRGTENSGVVEGAITSDTGKYAGSRWTFKSAER